MFNRIISYANTIGKKLGKGFTENVYQEALCTHLRTSSILYSKEQIIPISYKIENEEYVIGNVRADIVIPDQSLIIECKAIEGNLRSVHVPQIISYLRILNYNKGLLINFNQNPSKEMVEYITVEREYDKFRINEDEIFNMDGTKEQ
jgi:GxxExxY protein